MNRTGYAPQLITAVVVDDHPFFRDGVSRGLTQSGRIKVTAEASDGRSGLDAIRSYCCPP
jgi:two-component system nitrate/nitrite response regulator NarL